MGKKLLILSGPTHEYIDPVRYIGNASSGLMGKAIAEEALAHGYTITFVSGPVAPGHLPDIGSSGQILKVTGAQEMLNVAQQHFQTSDVVIFAAAVADYTPIEVKTEKMAKSEENLTLKLMATPDIAKTLCAGKTSEQIAIGFALQTNDGEANALRKLGSKNLDGIVLNTPASLGANSGTFSFLSKDAAEFLHWGIIDKVTCAKNILEQIK